MDKKEIESLLGRLDGSGSEAEWGAVSELRQLGGELPKWLLQQYRSARSWKARSSCVYHATRYAPNSEEAVVLGREALCDRSKVVRYRACTLLAYSQRADVVSALRDALATVTPGPDAEDFEAAIDAIECRNANYFVDRKHTGTLIMEIH